MNIYDLALAMTPRVGGRTAVHLINTFFSAENIFAQSYDELRERAKLSDGVARAIVNRDGMAAAEAELSHCERYGITPIAAVDEVYPSLLREIHDPPYVIYAQGDLSILTHNLVSVVGTRSMSSYGERSTELIVGQLAEKVHNLVIVSGLAYGIDSAAHRAALKYGVPTLAVLPCSLPGVSPAAHTALAGSILDSGGALITELRSTANTTKNTFLARNRIIAGVSSATIVVESKASGGAMSTAMIAAGEGRVVAAVPGRIVDSASAGCNRLIVDKSAIALTSAADLIRELKWEDRVAEQSPHVEVKVDALESGDYNDEQCRLLRCFSGSDPLSVAELEKMSELSVSQLGVALMELELMGAVKALPGARYESLLGGE